MLDWSLNSEQSQHHPRGTDQKAGEQVWTVMGKALCWPGQAGQGDDISGFSFTVSPRSCSLRKQEVPVLEAQWGPLAAGDSAPGRQAQKAAAFEREPSQEPSPAQPSCTMTCFITGSVDAPSTAAKGLTCQLSQFSAATAMGCS